ncbi:MAG TPA: polysaccharide deacetylase family protein [Chromatiaceae bacterium]|nr:polysaccharide deacetylase family protein [Chromatiaceae bacterium]
MTMACRGVTRAGAPRWMPRGACWKRLLLALLPVLLGACSGLANRNAPAFSEVIARNDNYIIVRASRDATSRSLAKTFLGDAGRYWLIEEENDDTPVRPGRIVVIPLRETARSGISPHAVQTVPVLCYHRFGDRDDGMMISARRFEQQMAYLRDNGYQVIPLTALLEFLEGRQRVPRKAVVLTIDDGHQSIYKIAYPILKKYGFPATVFIYSDYLGYGGLTWPQIHEMGRDGLIDIQAHSKTHANLNKRLPGESRAAWLHRIETEVAAPTNKLREHADTPVIAYAYPYGETNEQVIDFLGQYDYLLGFTVFPGGNTAYSYPYTLHRSMIFGDRGMQAFRKALNNTMSF